MSSTYRGSEQLPYINALPDNDSTRQLLKQCQDDQTPVGLLCRGITGLGFVFNQNKTFTGDHQKFYFKTLKDHLHALDSTVKSIELMPIQKTKRY